MAGKRIKPITLRNLPRPVADAVQEVAGRYRISLNKAVIYLLDQRVGQRRSPGTVDELDALAGSWSPREAGAARRSLKRLRRIDSELWK